MTAKSRTIWTFVVTSAALFMASLDNLVVTTALPSIRDHLHASLEGLQWTVNAYTLTFAVLLLTGATLGERYGRRRMFVIGLALFTAGSAAAALAPGIGALIAARAIQGVGAAVIDPADPDAAVGRGPPGAPRSGPGRLGRGRRPGHRHRPAGRRGRRRGRVLAVDLLAQRADRHRAAAHRPGPAHREPRAGHQPGPARRGAGQRGPARHRARRGPRQRPRLDQRHRAGAHRDRRAAGGGVRRPGKCGPASRCCPCTCSAAAGSPLTNAASLLMFFGMFGSIFLLAQFLQVVQHYSPLEAGLRTLPWTGMPVLVAPIAGALSDRIGGRPLLVTGLALQAIGLGWLAAVASPTVPYLTLVPAFVIAGVGMSLFFAPVANVVLSSVRRDQEGIASGANNAIRELGGVFGIAVLGAVFSAHGSYASGSAFVAGPGPGRLDRRRGGGRRRRRRAVPAERPARGDRVGPGQPGGGGTRFRELTANPIARPAGPVPPHGDRPAACHPAPFRVGHRPGINLGVVRDVPWWGVVSAAAAPLLLVGGWTAAADLQPQFDPVANTVSALAAVGATDRWVMSATFVVVGLCDVITALALRPAGRPGRLILIVGAISGMLVAAYPEHPGGFGSVPHFVLAATGFALLTTWPLGACRRGAAVPWALRPGAAASAMAVQFLLLAWFGAELIPAPVRPGWPSGSWAPPRPSWPLTVVLSARAAAPRAQLADTNQTRPRRPPRPPGRRAPRPRRPAPPCGPSA